MNPDKSFNYRSLFDLTGRVALVVGGGSGIGQARAEAMGAFGARSVMPPVRPTRRAWPAPPACSGRGQATHATVDARDTGSVETLISGVEREFGRLDVVLATPAINLRKRLLDYTDEEFDRVIDLNLKGTFRVARAAARVMVKYDAAALS
jgi:NAD(P)-dependent dehydrogenase (short-subunit alcohol dehydrogenase family)